MSRLEQAVRIKWVYIGMFVRSDGALRAVKKLYICLCAARDKLQPNTLAG
jgi:hypothetical protein